MGKKRSREKSERALLEAYEGLVYTPIESTGRPGTPHRYFEESYRVGRVDGEGCQQVLHKHPNGLVVVTAGESLPKEIESIQTLAKVSPHATESAALRRKHQSKMLHGKSSEGYIHPMDTIAKIKSPEADGDILLCSYVWGMVMEVNPAMVMEVNPALREDGEVPKVLTTDPLLDGYLCVVLPSGKFPPPKNIIGGTSSDERDNLSSSNEA